jgi:hypothetical protein
MIPFHLFLLSIFTKKKETEVIMEQYQHILLVNELREKSKDVQMNPYI